MSAARTIAIVAGVLALCGCDIDIAPADPGVTFTIDNRCGFDIETDLRLLTDRVGTWDLVRAGETARFAQADAEFAEFTMAVRPAGNVGAEVVTSSPSSAFILLTPGSGCPTGNGAR